MTSSHLIHTLEQFTSQFLCAYNDPRKLSTQITKKQIENLITFCYTFDDVRFVEYNLKEVAGVAVYHEMIVSAPFHRWEHQKTYNFWTRGLSILNNFEGFQTAEGHSPSQHRVSKSFIMKNRLFFITEHIGNRTLEYIRA